MDLLDWIAAACVMACVIAGLWALWAVNAALDDWDDAASTTHPAAMAGDGPDAGACAGASAADLAMAATP